MYFGISRQNFLKILNFVEKQKSVTKFSAIKIVKIVKTSITHGNVKFIVETSSSAHFKDNFILIKDWIGTIPLKLLVFLWEGGINSMEKSRGFIDFILPPSCKIKTKNFRAIVPIQFLIYIKFSLKWALDEVSTSKLMYLIQWEIDLASTSFTTHNWVLLKNLMWWTKTDFRFGILSIKLIRKM